MRSPRKVGDLTVRLALESAVFIDLAFKLREVLED
jgi:hypothetical protein